MEFEIDIRIDQQIQCMTNSVTRIALVMILNLSLDAQVFGSDPTSNQSNASVCNGNSILRSQVFERSALGSMADWALVLRSLDCLDGGDLEDAYISLGTALFAFPDRFSPSIAISKIISINDIIAISTMLPLEFVDSPCSRRNELARRRKIISNKDMFDQRTPEALQAVDATAKVASKWCEGR